MKRASDEEEYERAARVRDDIKALERALEKQAVVLGDGTDCDVIALAEDQLEAAVQIFYVRGGRIRGQRGWVVEKVEETTTATLVEHFLGQFYGDGTSPDSNGIPREVLVPELPPERRGDDASGSSTAAAARCTCAYRSAATRRPWPRPSRATPRKHSRCTSCAARAT